MAKYRIQAGDAIYEVEGPDDLTPETAAEFARAQLGGEYANAPVDTSGVKPQGDPDQALFNDIGTAVGEIGSGIAEGGANVLDHAADWAVSGLNAVGGLVGGGQWGDNLLAAGERIGLSGKNDLAGSVAPAAGGLDTLRGIGRFAGEAVATAPLGLLRGGAAVQGLAGGALLSDGRDAFSVAADAGLGALGSFGAHALLRGASAVAEPAVDDSIKTLIDAGVKVTPGQLGRSSGTRFGERLARTEDRATSTPFVGDRIVSDRNESLASFARATINRAVEPIGVKLPDNIKPGRAAVKWAGDKLSDAYEALLPRLRVQGDDQFLGELTSIHGDAQTLAPARVTQFNSILNDLGRFWQGGQALSGDALKAIDTRLGERVRRFSSSPDADQQDLGDALQSVRDALHGLAARQNPQYAGELQSINQGWKGLVQVEKASANSKAGISPAGYSQAVKQSSDTVRRRGYARGEALNQDLADAASDVLPSEIADSGTAGRWQQANIPALMVGAAQLPIYAGARAALPLMTRDQAISPRLAELLRYGAAAAPQLTTAGIAEAKR